MENKVEELPQTEEVQAEEVQAEEGQPQMKTAFEGSKHLPTFPTNVFEFGVKDAEDLKESLMEGISKIENPSDLPNWSSTNTLQLSGDFKELEDNILKAAEEVFGFLNYSFNELLITTLSAHTVTQADRSPPETYSNNILSGVYCLKAGGGKVVLTDPRPQAWNIRPSISEVGIFNSDVFLLEMIEGKMLVLPAWLQRFMVFPQEETTENIYFTWTVMLKS
tara:strand:+ start:1700 stop:2362 length:663 start_codon:yes stop_codon:yes gene_type:complete